MWMCLTAPSPPTKKTGAGGCQIPSSSGRSPEQSRPWEELHVAPHVHHELDPERSLRGRFRDGACVRDDLGADAVEDGFPLLDASLDADVDLFALVVRLNAIIPADDALTTSRNLARSDSNVTATP